MAINFNPMDGAPINGALFGAAGVVVGEVIEISLTPVEPVTLSVGVVLSVIEPLVMTFETLAPTVAIQYEPDTIEMLLTPLSVEAEIHVEPVVPLTELELEIFQHTWGTGAALTGPMEVRLTMLDLEIEVPVNLEVFNTMDLQFINFVPGGFIVIAFGQATMNIEQIITPETGRVTLFLRQVIIETGTASMLIEQIITDPNLGQASVQIQQIITTPAAQVSVSIQQSVWDDASFIPSAAGETKLWRPVVTLGGIDVSVRLTGSVRVEAEEGTARIAEFSTRPFSGVIDLLDWVGQPVTIDYATTDIDGNILVQVRLFTGKVDIPNYDPNTRITRFECTDDLQNEIEGLSRTEIDNLTPGTKWHEALFEEDTDNFSYLQDRLSTIDRFVDKDANGIFNYTPYAAKVTPDFLFDITNIVDQSLSIELASARDVTNDICIEFNYGFQRLRERRVYFKWSFPGAFCEFLGEDTVLTGSYSIPRRDMVIAAAESGNWCLENVSFTRLPQSQLVSCSVGLVIWVIGQELSDQLILGASGTIRKRFAQSINEKWNIRLQSPQSQAVYGQQKLDKNSNLTADYDTSEWELNDCETTIPITTLSGTTISEFFRDTDVDSEEGTARADADEVIDIEIAIARVEILEAHRGNIASFDLCMFPPIERFHTIECDTDTMDARGKVGHFVHVMDLTRGSAITTVRLALSRANPDACTPSETLNQPDTISDAAAAAENKILIGLPTQYGGIINDIAGGGRALHNQSTPDPSDDPNVLPEDEFTGYTGNKNPRDIGSIIYNERFSIRTTEIDEMDREPVEAEADSPVVVCVPHDFLELAA